MTSRTPWYEDQARGESIFRRTLGSTRRSSEVNAELEHQGPTGDDARDQPHQDVAVSSRRTPEQRASTRRTGVRPSFWMCETCEQPVEETDAVWCSGCNQGIHRECQEQLDIGESHHIEMCFLCTIQVTHGLRKARAARIFQGWNEDDWFQGLLDSALRNAFF